MMYVRKDYYIEDKYGYFLFSATRCFNDMSIVRVLLENLQNNDIKNEMIKINYSLYITKMYFSHLKEAIKLLDTISKDNNLYNHFCDDNTKAEIEKIKGELLFEDGSLTKKYLNIRHDVFHYDKYSNEDLNEFVNTNRTLSSKGAKVKIIVENSRYIGETACDILTLTKYFGCDNLPKEVMSLYNAVYKIIQNILTKNIN